jgi:glycosyltransferase involved in cell wall biosynthesis
MMIFTPRLEPFGLAPLEANACGTAVVAVAEGGIRETVFEGINGLLVNDARPAAIARAISRLLDDTTLASELGKRAESYVRERWSLTEAIDRLETILEATVSRERNHSTSYSDKVARNHVPIGTGLGGK